MTASNEVGSIGVSAQTIPRGRRPSLLHRLLQHPAGLLVGRLAIVAALLGFWELGSGHILPKVWISSPSAIFAQLLRWVNDGSLWGHLAATLSAAGIGYTLGAACGILSGLGLGLFPRIERIAAPFVLALYSLPKVAMAPFFIIFFGIGVESKIALVAITVYFLLLYNTLDGVRDLDRDLADTFRLMGASEQEIARKVTLPGILPWVFSGLRIGVRYAFTAAVLGELIAGNQGIGYLIEHAAGNYSASGVFAGVFVLVICSVLITEFIARSEQAALHWRT